MPARLIIADGAPVWLSQAIVPSRDTVISPNAAPQLAAVSVNATDVYVYVDVENPGTIDFDVCPCAPPLPAAWAAPPPLTGFLNSTTQSQTDTHGAFTFQARPFGLGADTLTGPGLNIVLPFGSGRRAWGWSPDGRMFVYVYEPGNSPTASGQSSWTMGVIALQSLTLSDGTIATPGVPLADATGSFDGSWTGNQFGWAGSKAMVAHGGAWDSSAHFFYGEPNATVVTIVSPLHKDASQTGYPPAGATWTATKPFSTIITGSSPFTPPVPHQHRVDWMTLVSPCGGYVAIVPKILDPSAPTQYMVLVETAEARELSFRQNNAVLGGVAVHVGAPSITTRQAGANGVDILTGPGTAITSVDDPECTLANGGVIVRVDRVKASTLPTANLGVQPIGVSAAGPLPVGQNRWVQVVNANGWNNQSEPHWCLLAQAYTGDGTTVIRPWFGDAANPLPFPLALENCAQRNIEILP